MDAGLYINLFEVSFENRETDFLVAKRSQHPRLRDFRKQLTDQKIETRIYAAGDEIYGYGTGQSELANFGFTPSRIHVAQTPPLASRLILEGYVDSLAEVGYTCWWSFGRANVYQFTKALLEVQGVRLYRGFELQSMYLLNPETEALTYGMIIDAVFTYRDANNKPLSTAVVTSKYGHDTLQQLRIKQGDFAPRGGINLEVSRQRFAEMILPFVAARHDFTLPCGILAQLNQEPVRVILSGEEQRQ